jgi:hypothetical protein
MKFFLRAFVTLIAMVSAFYFVFLVPFSLILAAEWPRWIPLLGSFITAVAAGRYVWKHTASVSQGLVSCVVMGALITGAVGFSAGFFGPIVVAPGANQGPLLGIFITGPLGFLLGAMGGAGYWLLRRRKATAAGGVRAV